jgi:hypothetical protein
MTALAGMDLSTEGNGVVELFSGVEASLCTCLSSYSLAVLGNFGGSSFGCSDWLVQRAREIHRAVGSCAVFGYSDSY